MMSGCGNTSVLASGIHETSEQILDSNRHLIDLRGVVLLNVAEDADVFNCDKVDGHSLAAKAASPSDSMDVVFSVAVGERGGEVGEKGAAHIFTLPVVLTWAGHN